MKKYLKMLLGFPVGVTVLMLTYVLIGAVDGQNTFTEEIMKLTEYKYLLAQIIFSGISYVIVAYVINVFNRTFSVHEDKSYLTWKDLGRFLVAMLIIVPICFTISAIIDRRGSLNGYVGEVFYGITVLAMILISIPIIVHNARDIRKINKALKERQAKENENE